MPNWQKFLEMNRLNRNGLGPGGDRAARSRMTGRVEPKPPGLLVADKMRGSKNASRRSRQSNTTVSFATDG
jgi:hypothetical protein